MREKKIYSVKQINSYIKSIIDGDFILSDLNVEGEISNCKYHRSGHIYFSLKDDSGVLSAVMFARDAARLKFRLADGAQVIASGQIGVYDKAGVYQLYVKNVESAGEGELYKKLEELKKKLSEMGMFAPEYKKPIPKFSYRIGVVTAQTGAVIRDIYNVSSRRNPYAQIILYPAVVQGDGAPESIIRGIYALDKLGLDVIIIGRGGGSIEDLWGFNDENVARAIFNSDTPIISAVGHETDFTIADFAADLRAPTPSAAAELAVFDYNAFINSIGDFKSTLNDILKQKIRQRRTQTEYFKNTFKILSPKNQIIKKTLYLQTISDSIDEVMRVRLYDNRHRLSVCSERLEGMSPLRRLSEGYAYVTDINSKALRSISQTQIGDNISIKVLDGIISAEVKDIKGINHE